MSLLLDLCSRFSQLLSSEALEPSGTFFVFSSYLSDAGIQGCFGSTRRLFLREKG
jgi:hypothetical protein